MAHHHRLPASTRRTLLFPPSSTKKACWASSGRKASSTVYSILPGCQRGYRRRSGKMAHYCHDRRQSRQAYKPREPEVCHATVDCRTRTIRCGFCALSANAFHLPCHSHSHACALFHRQRHVCTTLYPHMYTSPEFYFQRKSIRCFQFLCKRARPYPPARKHQQRQRQRLTVNPLQRYSLPT